MPARLLYVCMYTDIYIYREREIERERERAIERERLQLRPYLNFRSLEQDAESGTRYGYIVLA